MVVIAVLLASVISGSPDTRHSNGVRDAADAPQAAAAQTMRNADVIQLATAGLSDQVILLSIQQAPSKTFDLTPTGLVALKKAGVSDAVIQAMMGGGPTATSSAAPAGAGAMAPGGDASDVPPSVAGEDGVYYVNGAGVMRIEAKAPYQTRTGSKLVSRLTLGIKKSKLNTMLPGLSSDSHVGQAPSFYVHLAPTESIGEYYLIKFTANQQAGRRQLEVGSAGLGKLQAGFAEKDLFLIDVKRVEKDIYLVTPKTGLSAGEYALLVVPQAVESSQTGLTPRKIFDFSVR
jgi:hypothetical protein